MRLKDDRVQTGLDALAKKEETVAKQAQLIAKSVKMADEGLQAFANRTKSVNSTPVEKYQRQVALLNEALKRGKLSQEDHTRAVKRSQAELNKNALFGDKALGQLADLAGGYLTLQTAVNLVASAFRFARKESEEALGSLRGLDDARRNLNQISTSREDLQSKMSRADDAASKFGVDRKVAYRTLVDVYNEHIEGEYENIMAGRQVVDPGAAAKIGGKLQGMFPGLPAMQGINMTLAAAAASEADFEDFAPAIPLAAEGGRIAGASPEEIMASVSVLGTVFKSSQVAADRFKNLATKIGLDRGQEEELDTKGNVKTKHRDSVSGMGFFAAMDKLQEMDPEAREEVLKKDQETNAMYLAYTENEAKIKERAAELALARSGKPLADGIARAGSTEQLITSDITRKGEVNAELHKERQLATEEGARQAMASEQAGIANKLNHGMWSRFWSSSARGVALSTGMSAEVVGAAGVYGHMASNPFTSLTDLLFATSQGFRGQEVKLDEVNAFLAETLKVNREIRDAQKRGLPRAAQAEAKATVN